MLAHSLIALAQLDDLAPATQLDLTIVGVGGALVIAMLVFTLRRVPLAARATEDALFLGQRRVPWSSVKRMQAGRYGKWKWFRIETRAGLIELREADLAQEFEALRAEIAQRAELTQTPDARAPKELAELSKSSYEDWRRAEPAVSDVPVNTVRAKPRKPAGNKVFAALATAGALLFKFGKYALIGGKFLKLGKIIPTALTMVGTAWVYAQVWGWRFAVGFVVLILVHELGHALVIKAKGLRTGPIVFVPFFGAFINVKDQFRSARTEAETAWGGPATGALASAACIAVYELTGSSLWLGLGYVGCMLNLFNLLPVSPLDGGRIVTGISTWLWVVGLIAAGALALVRTSPILLIVVVLGAVRAWTEWRKARRGELTEYYDVTPRYRVLMACAYFGLAGYLGWLSHRALELGGHV